MTSCQVGTLWISSTTGRPMGAKDLGTLMSKLTLQPSALMFQPIEDDPIRTSGALVN